MNRKQVYQSTVVLVLSVVAMETGCTRNISITSPNTSNATGTFTAITTSIPTNTATSSATNTPLNGTTYTFTNTPTNTSTSTITNTPTYTATSTITNTVTNTATLGDTSTLTNTATSTATSTMTDTPTDTATSTATSTPTMTPTQVTFTTIYTTYIQPNSCVNCHNAGFPPDPSSQSNFYNSVVNQSAPDGCASLLVSPGNAGQSALYLRLSGTGCSPQMPESGGFILNAAQLADVAAWINEGALNN